MTRDERRIEKMERETQILGHITLVATCISALCLGFTMSSCCELVKADQNTTPTAGVTAQMMSYADYECCDVVEEETEVVTATEETTEEITYSNDDLELLAHLIWAECGATYNIDTYYKVGSVVLNRVESTKYPDDLYSVIYQRKQYTSTPWMWSRTPSDDCYDVAADLLTNGSVLPGYVLGQTSIPVGDGVYCEQDGIVFDIIW